jgi:hypothetical protein
MKKLCVLFLLIGVVGCTDVGDFIAEDAHVGYAADGCISCHVTLPPYTPGEIPVMDSIPGH